MRYPSLGTIFTKDRCAWGMDRTKTTLLALRHSKNRQFSMLRFVIHESMTSMTFSIETLGGGFKRCLFSRRSLGKGSNLTNILQRGWTHHLEENPSQILHVDNYMWWSSSWRGTMMLNTRTHALSNWSVWYNWSTPRKINTAPKNHPWKERKFIWTKPP